MSIFESLPRKRDAVHSGVLPMIFLIRAKHCLRACPRDRQTLDRHLYTPVRADFFLNRLGRDKSAAPPASKNPAL